ncbi:facilitated trehalose transporter Tret1-like [Neodiprion lecontei]|uniref:Facilitated trehalose transporter Tret1-like n=1 Tax=Neodiprion lecontei TaxID=441921 RepID=A0ABM3GA43_NEOLC|nr:facilitated trehalose transporter Tret1-like [Neodiprion lecontei]
MKKLKPTPQIFAPLAVQVFKLKRKQEWLRGTTNVNEEIEVVKKNVEFELKNAGTLKELFKVKGNRKALVILIGLMSASELSGIMAVSSYSTLILKEVGSGITPNVYVIITRFVQLVASIASVFLVDRVGKKPILIGRKTLLLLLSIPCLASGVLITFARNCWWYYVARYKYKLRCNRSLQQAYWLQGSVAFVVIPMYIGEIAEDKIRGGLGVLVIVMYNSGLVLVYSVGPWVSLLSLATIGIAIPAVSLATFVWIPESPYFYIMKNRPELARKSLQWLRGTTHVDEEIEVVKKNVEFDLQNAGTFKELLIDPGNGKGLVIVLFTCQQLSGILAVLSYSTIILNKTGSGATSSISVIVIGLIQFVASFAPLFMVDRIGRRPLLLGSMFFSIIFLISMYVLAVSP